jgi:hypothetical protein
MGKYVIAAQQRAQNLPPVPMPKETFDGGCPFSHAFAVGSQDGDNSCVMDVLTRDPRVSPELAVNLVMALFRTGIDSV